MSRRHETDLFENTSFQMKLNQYINQVIKGSDWARGAIAFYFTFFITTVLVCISVFFIYSFLFIFYLRRM